MKKKDMINYISKQALDTWEELLDLRVKILEINPKYLKMSRHALPATWPFTFYNSAYEKWLLLDIMCRYGYRITANRKNNCTYQTYKVETGLTRPV